MFILPRNKQIRNSELNIVIINKNLYTRTRYRFQPYSPFCCTRVALYEHTMDKLKTKTNYIVNDR